MIEFKITEQHAGEASPEKPCTAPRYLTLGVEVKGVGVGKIKWSYKFVSAKTVPLAPIRAYGLDGQALSPKIEIPPFKESEPQGILVAPFEVRAQLLDGKGFTVATAVRTFWARNLTAEEKKQAKLSRWITLEKEYVKGNKLPVVPGDGSAPLGVNVVFITLIQEWDFAKLKKTMWGSYSFAGSSAVLKEALDQCADKFWRYVSLAHQNVDPEEVDEEKPSPPPDPDPQPDPTPDPAPEPVEPDRTLNDVIIRALGIRIQIRTLAAEMDSLIEWLKAYEEENKND